VQGEEEGKEGERRDTYVTAYLRARIRSWVKKIKSQQEIMCGLK